MEEATMVAKAVTDMELKIRLAVGREMKDLEMRRSLELEKSVPWTMTTVQHPMLGLQVTVRLGIFHVRFYPKSEGQAMAMLSDGLTQAIQQGLKFREERGKDPDLVEIMLEPKARKEEAKMPSDEEAEFRAVIEPPLAEEDGGPRRSGPAKGRKVLRFPRKAEDRRPAEGDMPHGDGEKKTS